ncbi:hypothetical protein CP557_00495 [Natrinema ejinorense]|uniref:Uncharacterized protein n=1 Tax=Natrinema ejinorense TaxID=373386 RepID=A0A2A5QQS4_9EURY|nr:hypothetical protein CP557_00495 [Natrinema ejinorense]
MANRTATPLEPERETTAIDDDPKDGNRLAETDRYYRCPARNPVRPSNAGVGKPARRHEPSLSAVAPGVGTRGFHTPANDPGRERVGDSSAVPADETKPITPAVTYWTVTLDRES